ncbi:MAG: hypothetical protein IT370_15280 [Deltaproteobacteria bacterium]|nr:hypothetical protein [Deltaproteobacteria bacterium]
MKSSNQLVQGIDGLIEEGEALRRLGAERAQARPRARVQGARVFHTGMAVAFLLTAFAGFAPTYFLRGLSQRPALGPLLHLHGLVFTGWLVLLIVQSALVAGRRVAVHRMLGIAGALLALAMLPLGAIAALEGARRGISRPGAQPLVFLLFPLGQLVMFAGFLAAALWLRRKPESHRRLILVATATLMTPALSRLPFVPHPMVSLGLSALFVVAGMVHDWKTRGRVHRVYLLGAAVIVLSGPLRVALGHTAAWQSLARWLIS